MRQVPRGRRSRRSFAVGAAALVVGASVAGAAPQLERVSVAEDGSQSTAESAYGRMSSDGRYVAFWSTASLAANDTDAGGNDIFVRDRQAGTTTLASLVPAGTRTTGSWPATISNDGRYVAYAVVEDGEGGGRDLLVRDLVGASTEQADIAPGDAYELTTSTDPVLSPDGRFLAFQANGAPPDGPAELYVRDLVADTTALIPIPQSGIGGSNGARGFQVSVASGGRYVFFVSANDTLVAGDTNGVDDVFRYDRQDAVFARVSLTEADTQVEASSWSQLHVVHSDDGRYALFQTSADGVVSGDANGVDDTFIRDLTAGTTRRVSLSDADMGGNGGYNEGVSVTPDGRYAVFVSDSTDLVSSDDNGQPDVLVRDLQSDTTTRVSVPPTGEANNYSYGSDITADGARVLLESDATNLITGDSNDVRDVFLASVEQSGTGVIPIVSDPPSPPEQAVWHWGGLPLGGGWLVATKVAGLPPIASLAAGNVHALAGADDGTAWSWGNNGSFQLGDGTGTSRATPAQVPGLTGVVAVASGPYGYHSFALLADGTLRAWGQNGFGTLGDGTTTSRRSPVPVPGLTNVVAVGAGGVHSVALRSNGTVWTWGSNLNGELGDGTTTGRLSPNQVPGLTGIVAIGVGASHSLALRSDGTVWAWGGNGVGQLGDGTFTGRSTPTQVSGLTGVVAISAGHAHSLALRSDGTVLAWGYNNTGQLGDGTRTTRTTPASVVGLGGVIALTAGVAHSLALRSDGTVRAWGNNSSGQLGVGPNVPSALAPVAVVGLSGVSKIAAGGNMSFAIGTASTSNGRESGGVSGAAGGSVSSDVEGDGATAADPVEVTVMTPTGGQIAIRKIPGYSPSGFGGWTGIVVQIEAPVATAANPLVLTFRLDVSAFPVGWDINTADLYRNVTTLISQPCTGTGAEPDPCIASRTRLADGDVEIVVRTSRASDWEIFARAPIARAGGPYVVAEGSSTTLDGGASSGAAPLTFSWLPDPQLTNETTSQPTFAGVDDGSFRLGLDVTDVNGIRSAPTETAVVVTNRAPAVSQIGVVKNEKRRLELGAAFADPGRVDTHTATINWGDGTQTAANVAERNGVGLAGGGHTYQRKGNYTVTITVRDDDGGSAARSQTISVRG